MTREIALAAPVVDGIRLPNAERPVRRVLERTAVHNFLLGSCGVDRRHQTIFNSIIVFQYFTDRCQTVGRAGCIGHNGHIFRITGMVDSHDECRCFFIFCRCRNNDFFCTTLQVSTCFFCRAKCSELSSMMYSAPQEPQGMEAASPSVKTGIFCPLMISPCS